MFGLEGSGFVVCLGLILFLIGLVMFYVRQRFADQEAKLNQVISIIPVMTQQIQLHEQELHPNMFHKDTPSADSNPLGTIPEDQESKIDVSSSDESEDESESEPESDDEEEEQPVRNIVLGTELELREKPSDNIIQNEESGIKLVTMGLHEDNHKDKSGETTPSSEDGITTTDGGASPDELEEITIPITAVKESVDYTKMSVAALRQVVQEKGLSTHTSKLKKTECLNLLQ